MFRSDAILKLNNSPMTSRLLKHNIHSQKLCLDTQHHNAVENRHLLKMAHAFVIVASVHATYRVDVVFTTIYTIHCLPTPIL